MTPDEAMINTLRSNIQHLQDAHLTVALVVQKLLRKMNELEEHITTLEGFVKHMKREDHNGSTT